MGYSVRKRGGYDSSKRVRHHQHLSVPRLGVYMSRYESLEEVSGYRVRK